MSQTTVERALDEYRRGRLVIIVDDEDRENEGDLSLAAQFATPEKIHFMAREGRGLICVSITGERADALDLPLMVPPGENSSQYGTPFTVSVDARRGVTTGISAHDRATTIQTLIAPSTLPGDLARPGHVFPLRAASGGILERRGQTEASLDLARLAGLEPAGVICEILAADGSMARGEELERFARVHGLAILSVEELVEYRQSREGQLSQGAEAALPNEFGAFRLRVYVDETDGTEHLALYMGDLSRGTPLVRLHSECLTGEVLGSRRCDCRQQLVEAQRLIAAEGTGAVIYLRQEGRGIGLAEKIKAYALQDLGLDTVDANRELGHPDDGRDYGAAAWILQDLECRRVRLLTNNPAKVAGLAARGIDVAERVHLVLPASPENAGYLATKRARLGHLLPEDALAASIGKDGE
jgi:3,4-dihydroxy 2-butanone 4-phosphate synthase/GTP cyclohydrolase II